MSRLDEMSRVEAVEPDRKSILLQALADVGVPPESQGWCASALLSHMERFELYRNATGRRRSRNSKLAKLEEARRSFEKAKRLLADPLVAAHLKSIFFHRLTVQSDSYDIEGMLRGVECISGDRLDTVNCLIDDLRQLERQISMRGDNADEDFARRGKNASRPDINLLGQLMLPTIARSLGNPTTSIKLSDSSPYVAIAAKVFELVGEYDSSKGNIETITRRLRSALIKLTKSGAAPARTRGKVHRHCG